MTDFGLIGKVIDLVRGRAQSRDEKKLRERFVFITNELKAKSANVYAPAFGSDDYWEAMEMAKRGWLQETHFGFVRAGIYNSRAFGHSLY